MTAYQPNDEVAIVSGQSVEIRQIALSPDAYDYYVALFDQNALGSGDPFSIPPANVRGNVRNLTNPDQHALGYFEAAEVSVATAIAGDPDGQLAFLARRAAADIDAHLSASFGLSSDPPWVSWSAEPRFDLETDAPYAVQVERSWDSGA